MQVGKVSWAGQTFALARCSDSQGKKPRNRRTKEERRKMVESFIGRYRDSNNGNFPSLNLTHKEVGGSFYTVREIVREIIQENKVLRPGNLNSQAFNLDDCSEQHVPEPLSADYPYSLSLTMIDHSSNERQREAVGCILNQNINEVLPTFSSTISGHHTIHTNEEFALSSHDILIPQVIDEDSGEEQHHKIWHTNVDSTKEKCSKEPIELSGQGQNYLSTQNDEETYVEHKASRGENFAKCATDDPIVLSQPLSMASTVDVSIAADTKGDMQVNDTSKAVSSFVERENAFEMGHVRGQLQDLSSSGHAGGSSPSHAGDFHPLHSTDSTVRDSEQMSLEKAGLLKTSGLTEASVIASKNVSSMPVYSEPTLNSTGSLSSLTVDHKAEIGVKASITDLADCPTCESTNRQVQTSSTSSNGLHTELITPISGRTPGESGLENCIGDSNAEKSTLDETSRESSEAGRKTENAEANPLLAIIKGLVTAFIKFWTE